MEMMKIDLGERRARNGTGAQETGAARIKLTLRELRDAILRNQKYSGREMTQHELTARYAWWDWERRGISTHYKAIKGYRAEYIGL